ncbi:MAG: hypothetical protein U1E73_00420 [Planctomycetota bacterium]
MRLHLAIALAATTAAISLPAQTPDHLVGLTRVTSSLRHQDHWNCQPINQCATPLPPSAAFPPSAGGTGWDPVRSGAWVTNGLLLCHVDDACNVNCAPIAIPGLPAGAFATGLEVVQSQGQIWITDTLGNIHFFTNTCPPNPIGICNTGLGPTAVGDSTSDIAVDEGSGIVFISYCNFTTGVNRIAVSRAAAPCNIVCVQQIQVPCLAAFGTITGIACDWGRRILYATDGINTIAMQYVAIAAAGCVQFQVVNCCALPVAGLDPMVDLAIRPGRATSVGQPCANGTCPACPMIHHLANDPVLGNAQFALQLDQAPTGGLAWAIIGVGPCGPGVIAPPLCGPIFATPVLGTIGPIPTGGFGGCTGAATFPLGLPAAPALAGWTMSSQAIALCAGGGFGTSVANCLSFTLQGL